MGVRGEIRAQRTSCQYARAFFGTVALSLASHQIHRSFEAPAIDRDLDQRGLVDKDGQPRYLLIHRSRTSRQLEHWLEKVSAAIERQTTSAQAPLRAEFPDYVKALQRIALDQDATATARDRLAALKELLELGPSGTTSYLERPADADLREREYAIREAVRKESIAERERKLGIG